MKTPTGAGGLQADLDYLYSLNGRGIKPGLERIQKLLAELGDPQIHLKTIHIAGTNGKGSTCAIIASILRAAGFRVGLYTSPHLLRFNERIRIGDVEIKNAEIAAFTRRWRPLIDRYDCSFFEATTAMALDHFRNAKVDFVVLETGMGGRFDATNVVRPEVTVITPIARDHQEFLGGRLQQIAFEKAGIAKADTPCVVARQTPRVGKILTEEIQSRGSQLFWATEHCHIKANRQYPDYQELNLAVGKITAAAVRFPLIGTHQLINLQAALTAVSLIKDLHITEAILRNGIAAVAWPGRLQILHKNPLVFYDVGHNQHGIRSAVSTLKKQFPGRSIHLILALGVQKKFDRIGKIIRILGGEVYVTEMPGHSSVTAELIAKNIRTVISSDRVFINPDAVKLLNHLSVRLKSGDMLLIIGSHYLAPTVYRFFRPARA